MNQKHRLWSSTAIFLLKYPHGLWTTTVYRTLVESQHQQNVHNLPTKWKSPDRCSNFPNFIDPSRVVVSAWTSPILEGLASTAQRGPTMTSPRGRFCLAWIFMMGMGISPCPKFLPLPAWLVHIKNASPPQFRHHLSVIVIIIIITITAHSAGCCMLCTALQYSRR